VPQLNLWPSAVNDIEHFHSFRASELQCRESTDPMPKNSAHPRGLMLIAAFKLFKGLALLIVGIGAHTLVNKDLVQEAQHWVDLLRIDPHNHYLHQLLEKLSTVDAKKLRELSLGTFIYSGLFLTEGIGLALRKRWAEYLTTISTAGLIPLEVYELVKHPSAGKGILLVVNIAVVAYLIRELYRTKKH
jgi:uncharacterized membrane protein (DUF2068 family)